MLLLVNETFYSNYFFLEPNGRIALYFEHENKPESGARDRKYSTALKLINNSTFEVKR